MRCCSGGHDGALMRMNAARQVETTFLISIRPKSDVAGLRAIGEAFEIGSTTCRNRQSLDGPETCSCAPENVRIVRCQLQLGPTLEQGSQRALTLNTRELMSQAKMNPSAEGDVPVRPSLEIELVWMIVRLRIEVCGGQHGHYLGTALQPNTAKFHVLAYEARFGELHWGNEAQKFLDGEIDMTPVLFQPIA